MIYGFTGASEGMTEAQRATVKYLFHELQLTELHHGDCVGADAQAHRIVTLMGVYTVGHPPKDSKARAFCGCNKLHEPKAYLARDKDIAKDGIDGLIAAPPNRTEVIRGIGAGTWATVRYARKLKRRILIVYPDGTFKEENNG